MGRVETQLRQQENAGLKKYHHDFSNTKKQFWFFFTEESLTHLFAHFLRVPFELLFQQKQH